MNIIEYHSNKTAVSSSDLKNLDPPALYKANVKKDSPSMALGSAVHTLLLEPEKFELEYLVADGRTKEAKEAKASGISLLNESTYQDVLGMVNSVKNHTAFELLSNGVAEQSFFWEEPVESKNMRCHYCDTMHTQAGTVECECGNTITVPSVLCKIRPDFLGKDYFVDLKTTNSAHPNKFKYTIRDFKYHLSAAMYWRGLEMNNLLMNDFYWIAVETSYPYLVAVYRPDEALLDLGRKLFYDRLKLFRLCRDTNTWPGYVPVSTISLETY